jgi:hypothetical protein
LRWIVRQRSVPNQQGNTDQDETRHSGSDPKNDPSPPHLPSQFSVFYLRITLTTKTDRLGPLVLGGLELWSHMLHAVLHHIDQSVGVMLRIRYWPANCIESGPNTSGRKHPHASAVANNIRQVLLHETPGATSVPHDSKMFITFRERNSNGYVSAAGEPANAFNGLHHAVVIVHDFGCLAHVYIARIDQQDDSGGMIDVVDQQIRLLITTAFHECPAKDLARVIKQYHCRSVFLPTDINAAGKRSGCRRGPAAGLQLVDHVHADLMQRSVQRPHVQPMGSSPRLFVEP